MLIGNREFDTVNGHYVMGILNVTPDSFSDGGRWNALDAALRHTEDMIEAGADIIDIGGESTRPGHTRISDRQETDRVVPVIEAVCARFDVPVSVDTYKSAVASAAVQAGASLVNDIWGLKYDPDMAGVIARSDAACCLMHNRDSLDYTDFMEDMLAELRCSADLALAAGVCADRIILDPGVGFGKTHDMSLEVIRRLDLIAELGYPVLLGTSRKSVIGFALGLPVEERLEGTLATTVIGVMRGCSFFRVHDVKDAKRAIAMTEAVMQPAARV